jgi:hypothetical protein
VRRVIPQVREAPPQRFRIRIVDRREHDVGARGTKKTAPGFGPGAAECREGVDYLRPMQLA